MKIRMKSKEELKPYRQAIPTGDMDENTYYAIKVSDGSLVPTLTNLNDMPSGVIIYGVHWGDYEQEYLVVDHDNPISKNSYNQLKNLFKEEE